MDAGVHLPLIDFGGGGFSYRRLAETVDAARACGFGAVSANDHFVFSAPWLDGLTALAAVVERSGGMKLVTTVALAALRGPVPLAKALSALDVLSDGRVIAGVGPGSSKADYDAVGVPFEQRWQRFDDTLQLIKALLQPAAAGGAAFGTEAKPVEGGWLVNGKKIWSSLSLNWLTPLCSITPITSNNSPRIKTDRPIGSACSPNKLLTTVSPRTQTRA